MVSELVRLRQDGEREVGNIIENAKREAQQLRRKAQEDGFHQGEKAGLEKGERERKGSYFPL